ncbi:MAG: hypothetical protein NVSMB64_33120 [Candidatus Velthaea sp.]
MTRFRQFASALALAITIVPAMLAPASAQTSMPAPVPAATDAPKSAPLDVTLVPKGTAVVVRTVQGYNSYSAKTGAKLRYEVLNDVIVDGHIVARAGDTAEGAVQDAQQGDAGGFYGIGYKAANLRVSVEAVYTFCADTLPVDFDRSEYRRRQGFFGSNKDVQVTKGQLYVAETDRPQKVCSVATRAMPAPIPEAAIRRSDK